ncbi:MAG: ArsA-related P-loop ATPase [Polyangiaceae bacterium]
MSSNVSAAVTIDPALVSAMLSRRILLVTGKGGVGKTAVAGALALAARDAGKRVLAAEIASEDSAPSPLAHALGAAASDDDPIEVAPGVKTVRIVPTMGHHEFLRDTMPMRWMADAAMKSAAIRRFLVAAPTLSEMGVLYRLLDLTRARHREGGYEHEIIVVDLPATGHALALTQLPEAMLRIIPGGPIVAAVKEGLALVTDPEVAMAVVVALPETLPVSEAIELSRGLMKHNVPFGCLALNRVPPNPFSEEERAHVERLVEGKGDVLGLRSVRRIDRARAATARIHAELGRPLLALPDLAVRAAKVSEGLASVLRAT